MTVESTSAHSRDDSHLIPSQPPGPAPEFQRGEGVELIDAEGIRYLDAASGVGVTALGYSANEVSSAMQRQAEKLQYLHNLRFRSPVTSQLAAMVAEVAPEGLEWVFFVSGGSEANETAMKLVRQHWLERGQPERWKVIGRRPSFHGNTLGTLSAGWHVGRRDRYQPMLIPFPHVGSPNAYRGCGHCRKTGMQCTLACADELEAVIRDSGVETVAAFIAEPVTGAAGGAQVPPEGYFQRTKEICDRYDVLMIADEVITGFGRLGTWFGSERVEMSPDIIVFAKGISAGYAPLGGVIASDRVVEPILAGSGRFDHNFTMAGHPVAAAAGIATLELMHRQSLVERVRQLEPIFFSLLQEHLADVPIVGDIRGLGLLAGVELVQDQGSRTSFASTRAIAAKAAGYGLEERVIVYPAGGGDEVGQGDYLLLMPPLVSTAGELEQMADRLARSLTHLSDDLRANKTTLE